MSTAGARNWMTEIARTLTPVAIVAAGIAIYLTSAALKPSPPKVDSKNLVPQVNAATVTPFTGDVTFEVDGTVVPFREVTLSAEAAGRVVEIAENCRAGRFVTEGTLLCAIDPSDYELEVERLQEELEQAKLQVEQMNVDVSNSELLIELASRDLELKVREVGRLQKLKPSGTVTVSEVEQAQQSELASRNLLQVSQNRRRLLEAERRALQQSIELTQTRLEQANLNLRRTRITAPFDGVIVSESLELGTYVQRGTTLFTIEDVSAMEVTCRLRADQLHWVWENTPLQQPQLAERYELPHLPAKVIYSLGDRQYQWDGVLARYDGAGFDPQTRMAPCRVLVEQPRTMTVSGPGDSVPAPRALMRGMYVSVRFQLPVTKSFLTIPRAAHRMGDVVWKVESGKLSIVPVRIARSLGDQVLLEPQRTLQAGDQVITSPLAYVTEQQPVEVVENAPAPVDGADPVDEGAEG